MSTSKACTYLLGIALLLCAIWGCDKRSVDVAAVKPKNANVGFYNLLPSQSATLPYPGAIDMYVNGTRQNANKIPYGYFSGYMGITSGAQNFSFTSDSLRNEILPSTSVKLDTTFYTTIFVAGKANASNITLIRTLDTAKADASLSPKLRFVHASADAPAFDLVLTGIKSSIKIGNQAYKSVSTFSRVDTGKVALKLNLAGTSTNVLSGTLTLGANGIYTVFVYGLYAGGVNSITLGVRSGY